MSLKVKLLAIMAGILALTVTLNFTVLTAVVQPAFDGKGGLTLEAKTPRTVAQVGSDAIGIELASLFVVSLIELAIMWFLVQVFVLRPVSALKEQVMRVTGSGNLKDRIPVSGSDELALLARKYNDMLGDIEQSNQDLLNAQTEQVKQERLSAIGALTAVVSHEIRNPLATIRTNLFAIQQKMGEVGPAVQHMLARADRNVERCNDTISELLQFVDENKPVTQELEADIWIYELLKQRFHVEDVAVTHDYGAAAVTFAVDPQQMGDAVVHLVENAVQAMDDNPAGHPKELVISTRIVGGRYQLVIRDNGPGMDRQSLAKVFEPLFSTKGYGVGLGIPIVQKIVKSHGGDISYDSERGKGTIVTLTLPLVAATKMVSPVTQVA